MEKYFIAFLFIALNCCQPAKKSSETVTDTAQMVVDSAIAYHGAGAYQNLHVAFTFRNMNVSIWQDSGRFRYVRHFKDTLGKHLADTLNNQGFSRYKNGEKCQLSSKDSIKYAEGINAIAYFTLLPSPLRDEAVIKTYLGKETIKDIPYYKIKVTFKADGGGSDYDDKFIYWFSESNFKLTYLAYSYHREGGGTRFREAISYPQADGVTFINYINYKPATEMPVEGTGKAFERGQLKEVSRIINKSYRSI